MRAKTIVLESSNADLVYAVRQVGRVVIVTTDSPAQAMALVRRIDRAIVGEGQGKQDREADSQAIGFQADPED